MITDGDSVDLSRQQWLSVSGCTEMMFLDPAEQFDTCIVGIVRYPNRTVLQYSRPACLAALQADGADAESAAEMLNDLLAANQMAAHRYGLAAPVVD